MLTSQSKPQVEMGSLEKYNYLLQTCINALNGLEETLKYSIITHNDVAALINR